MNRKQRRIAGKQAGPGGPRSLKPASPAAGSGDLFALALACHQAGQLAQAEQHCRQLLALEPKHADGLHLLGVLARQAGHNQAAAELIASAIAVRPVFPEAHSNLGNAQLALGRADLALASYRKAVLQKPGFAQAHFNLANVLRMQNQHEDAIASYRACLALRPDMAEAHYLIGISCQTLGRLHEAAASYNQTIALNPAHAEAHNNLGVALKDLGRTAEALVCYQAATGLVPRYAEAHNNLGNALALLGRLDDAAASYVAAIAARPGYDDAHYNLGNALKALGRERDAVAAFQMAYEARTRTATQGHPDERTGATTLFLELTNKCNFHCDFCPSDAQTRPTGVMDIELAKKILNEVSARNLMKKVDLHLMGEPLLHPNFLDILAYAASKNLRLELVTNGSPFTPKTVPGILDGLYGNLIVSLQTPTAETFPLRGAVGLGWERYIEGIRLLVRDYIHRAHTKGSRAEVEIRVMVTEDTDLCVDIVRTAEEVQAIHREWIGFVTGVEMDLGLSPFPRLAAGEGGQTLLSNGGSFTKYGLQRGLSLTFWRAFTFANTRVRPGKELRVDQIGKFCPHPFEDAGILWNGDVTLCCLDFDGQLTVGNVSSARLEDILDSEQARLLRASMLARAPRRPFCAACQASPVDAVSPA